MKAKVEQEKKTQNKTSYSNKGNVKTQNSILREKPLKVLAKCLALIELRDSCDLDKKIASVPQIAEEISKITPNESKFIGIIANCIIPGCDVHALNSNFEIMSHFKTDEQIDPLFEHARTVAKSLPHGVIGILVFSDHLSYIHINGDVEVCS